MSPASLCFFVEKMLHIRFSYEESIKMTLRGYGR